MVEYRGHIQTTACCVFLPTGHSGISRVATSSHDGSLKIWDQNTAGKSKRMHGCNPYKHEARCFQTSGLGPIWGHLTCICGHVRVGIYMLYIFFNCAVYCKMPYDAAFHTTPDKLRRISVLLRTYRRLRECLTYSACVKGLLVC